MSETPIVPTGFVGTRVVQEHGGSKQVVVPSELAERAGIEAGDEVVFCYRDGEIVVRPADGE